jgi:D-alanyl-D-alanine carboxypeptidase (penicillin-binding protein 5/6)
MRTLPGRRVAPLVLRCLLALTVVIAETAATLPPAAAQQERGSEPILKSTRAVLMDADTGAILYQKNADELVPPASMSKIMLLLMVFMALRSGELKLDAEFVMSLNAWRTGGAPSRTSSMFVPLGKSATVDELLKGVIVQSGNDAAICLAENMKGSEALAAEWMTQEARRLGLKKSVFKNATGLPHPEHVMTMREIAALARHVIQEYPEYYPMFAQKEFQYRRHKFVNRNPLLGVVPGVDGLKTGFVEASGYGLVASAKQDNRRLIIAISGAESQAERKDDGRRLLEWGFKNYSEAKIFDAGEVVGHARVWGGERMYMPLVGGNGGVSVVLPKVPINPKVTARIYYVGPLKPPLKKGQQVATLRVKTNTDATSDVPLYAAEDIERAGFMWRGLDSLLYLATRWIP